jgi:hypothetical protein
MYTSEWEERGWMDEWMEEHFSLRSVLSWLMKMVTLAFDLGSFSRVCIFPLSTPTGWWGWRNHY